MRLTTGQMIALGIAIVFGIPILAMIIAGRFVGFWGGVFIGGIIFVIIVAIGQRHMKKQSK